MTMNNKIAWLESQYLFPHHFEQQERYFEYIIEQRASAVRAFAYGFSALSINQALLNNQQFSINNIKGIMPDGCVFDSLINTNLPTPLEIPETVKNQKIYLALPTYQPGQQFLTTDGNQHQAMGRYTLEQMDAFTYSNGHDGSEQIEIARLQPRFLLESEELGGFTYLPVARIAEVTPEKSIILDKNFIPPVTNLKTIQTLLLYLENIVGLLEQRGNALADRFTMDTTNSGSSAISDFMLLQLINRYSPRLEHYRRTATTSHPEALYTELLGLMGELATFTTTNKRPAPLPNYTHDDLYMCFQPLIQHINIHLSSVLEQTAISLPIEKRQYGIYVSPISDRSILENSRLILAVKADMVTNDLKLYLPDHLKIGSVDTIRDLVNNQLTGITVNTLTMAPREITYTAGFVYFELNEGSGHWNSLKKSAGFAFHIAGELANLDIEFWAIRT